MARDYNSLGYEKAFTTPLTEGPEPQDEKAPLTGDMEMMRDITKGPADPLDLFPPGTFGGRK